MSCERRNLPPVCGSQRVRWFIEANAQAGSIEGSIVLTQAAFEVLPSAVLVENLNRLSNTRYGELGAAGQVRELLCWAGIPSGVPAALAELTRAAASNNWPDAPTAMIRVRKTIIHPSRQNREVYRQHSDEVRTEVWKLGLWALELCLLRLFEYRGKYLNRIAQRVEDVPWATAGA